LHRDGGSPGALQPHECASGGGWRLPAIRAERPLRPSPATDNGVNDENFFVAKIRDSDSATHPSNAPSRLARSSSTHRIDHARVEESAAAQPLPANLTIADVGGAGVSRIVISTHCIAIDVHAACVGGFLRQHFLKRDAVFFDLLVYSE
jgi:hypothetical protein